MPVPWMVWVSRSLLGCLPVTVLGWCFWLVVIAVSNRSTPPETWKKIPSQSLTWFTWKWQPYWIPEIPLETMDFLSLPAVKLRGVYDFRGCMISNDPSLQVAHLPKQGSPMGPKKKGKHRMITPNIWNFGSQILDPNVGSHSWNVDLNSSQMVIRCDTHHTFLDHEFELM